MSIFSSGQESSPWSAILWARDLPLVSFLRKGVTAVPVAVVPTNGGAIRLTIFKTIQRDLQAASEHFKKEVRPYGKGVIVCKSSDKACLVDLLKYSTFASFPIPESLLFRMRDVRNYSDFVSQFLEGYPDITAVDTFEQGPGILGKKGPVGGGGAAAAVPNPEPGTCLPSKQLVEFPKPSDPSIILWPPCTRVPRCGGCCPSSILKCAPTKTSNVTFKVIKAQYPEPGASKFNFVGHEIVTLEKHDKCGCECKERPSDCNALQQYTECRCVCRNTRDMEACSGPEMLWDHRDCRCKCRDYAECSSGFFYNVRSCRCEQLSRSRIGSRILQPLPKLYGPYTDNRENLQSRSFRNLDLVAADDYSRAYTDVRVPPVRRQQDVTTGSASPYRTLPASSALPQWRQRSTLGPRSTPFQRLDAVTTTGSRSTTRRRNAA